MSGADRLFATPAGVTLGPVDAIPDGRARSYVVQLRAGRFHGFVVRQGDTVFGYVDRCPHWGLPLAQTDDAYITSDGQRIACSWHSALFAISTGACVGGPCLGSGLTPWPVTATEGVVVTTGGAVGE